MNQLALSFAPNAKAAPTTIVAQVLARHRGEANGIGVKALALECLITERAARLAVTELRMQGVGVCGRPETGYYLPNNDAELEKTFTFLRARAMKSLTLESRMRKVALADLLGQLRIPT